MEQTIDGIFQQMLADFRAETGLEAADSLDLSVRLYTVAAQVHALYLQGEWVKRQCFPQTAQGDYLDQHAALRALERRQAVRAAGRLRFSLEQAADTDLTVAAGTVCMTPGQVRFVTLEEAVIPAGSLWAEADAQAAEAGPGGNVAADTVTIMAVAPVGVARCTNPEAFSGGVDAEDDDALRQRVLDTYRRLSNGANAAYYEQEALSFDQVAAAVAVGRSRGTGTVDVVVSGWDGAPEEALLEQLREHFRQRREIAVDVQVKGPETRTVDVSVALEPEEGADQAQVLAQAEAALRGWFDGRRLGKPVLLAQLGTLVFGVDGVANYAFSAPAADVAVERTELPVLGTLTVGWKEG